MKKILIIIILLVSTKCYAQWPSLNLYSAAEQVQIRANITYAVNRGLDSLKSSLPAFRKGTIDSLDKLNIYLTAITVRLNSLEQSRTLLFDSIGKVAAKTDTSWKAAVSSLQKKYDDLLLQSNQLSTTVNDLKAWADMVKTINISFK